MSASTFPASTSTQSPTPVFISTGSPGQGGGFATSTRFDTYGLTNDTNNTLQNWNEATLHDGNVGDEYSSSTGVVTSQLYNLNSESGADVSEFVLDYGVYAPMRITGPNLVSFLNNRINDADNNDLVTFVTIVDGEAGKDLGWGYASKEISDETLRPSLVIQHSTVAPEVDPYPTNPTTYTHQMEDLDRGLIAKYRSSDDVYVSWRMLGTDPADVSFNLYRKTHYGGGSYGPTVKVNTEVIENTTDYVDTPPHYYFEYQYFVRPIVNGVELGPVEPASIPNYAITPAYVHEDPPKLYFDVPLSIPAPVNGHTYYANDASVGDLDGDGEYEIVLKWMPPFTTTPDFAPMYLDAYKLDGTQLWRIDLGKNVSSGQGDYADAMQFMVYDLDGDGKAEVAMNTAPGAKDGLGNWVLELGDDQYADNRNSSSYNTGPEYFSIFDGETGGLLENIPLEPARGTFEEWGDDYGHRATTFNMGIAYLDGVRPSVVIGRGIYHADTSNWVPTGKTEMTAYNWRDGQLTEEWTFTATYGTGIGTNENPTYVGMGNQQLTIGDVDGDGYDEINWGAMVVDHDGTGLYSTGIGHGDALHMADMDPTNPGLEVFKPNESSSQYADAGAVMYDAMTGEKLVKIPSPGGWDVGRGVAGDIDPNSPGYEMWAITETPFDIYAADGSVLYEAPSNMFNNFLVWWDGDVSRELLDDTTISKWNGASGRSNFDLSPNNGSSEWWAPGTSSNNSTKATPALSADILGDWREEVIWRKSDNTALRIFSTPYETDRRMVTLMHDRMYREAIAWQNSYYNQPPHPSFFLGEDMDDPPLPDIYMVSANPNLTGDFDLDLDVDDIDLDIWGQAYGTTQSHGYLPGDADGDGTVSGIDFLHWQRNVGQTTTALTAALSESTISISEQVVTDAQFESPGELAVADASAEVTPEYDVDSALRELELEESPIVELAGLDTSTEIDSQSVDVILDSLGFVGLPGTLFSMRRGISKECVEHLQETTDSESEVAAVKDLALEIDTGEVEGRARSKVASCLIDWGQKTDFKQHAAEGLKRNFRGKRMEGGWPSMTHERGGYRAE